MSHYGILLPGFWGGDTGRKIASIGGVGAQVLALYLTANPDANMIGLYQIELVVVRARIGTLTPSAIAKAFVALEQAEFADYDDGTGFVWVHEMAKYRANLHLYPMKRDDNRVKAVNKLYAALRPNPFLEPFFARYAKELHITRSRAYEGVRKGIRRPFEAPSKPVNRNSIQEDQEPRSSSTALRAVGEV